MAVSTEHTLDRTDSHLALLANRHRPISLAIFSLGIFQGRMYLPIFPHSEHSDDGSMDLYNLRILVFLEAQLSRHTIIQCQG